MGKIVQTAGQDALTFLLCYLIDTVAMQDIRKGLEFIRIHLFEID